MWNFSILWECIIFVQKNAHGNEYSPSCVAIVYNTILSCLLSRKYCEAIMDDLLLFTPTKQSQFEKLNDLLKALCKNSLKISPRKCQLFKTELQYMGNTIVIKDKRVCVKPLRSRIQYKAMQRLKPPTTPKVCRSFAGMVNLVSIFCPELQKTVKTYLWLNKKCRPFYGDRNSRMHLKKSRADYKNPKFSVCLTEKTDLYCILTAVRLWMAVHYINSKMGNPDLMPTWAKEYLRQPKTILLQSWKCVFWP